MNWWWPKAQSTTPKGWRDTSRRAESEKSIGDSGFFRRPVRKIPQFIPSLGLKSNFNQGALIAH
jgi:hypothetical protein